MKYKSFRIKNYKAIKDLTIEVDKPKLTPIIGLNETGKSSILQAMFSFDYTNDKQYNGEFVNISYIKNKFNNKSFPEIEAEIENIDTNTIIENALDYFMEEKKEDFLKKSRYRTESAFRANEYLEPIKALISSKLKIFFHDSYKTLKIKRIFNENSTYYTTEDFSFETINKIINVNGYYNEEITIYIGLPELREIVIRSIVYYLPNIIYIDDFKDIVPEEIKKGSQWYPYIEEIFEKNNENIDKFSKYDLSDRQTVLADIKDDLNESLSQLWDKMHISKTIRDEFKTLDIDLRFENNIFQFLVVDLREKRENGKSREVVFPVNMRSKGFQWFFNFFIKMKYNWKHTDDEDYGSIILLDEPGVYLHTTFQSELVKVLRDLSKNNIIFYTTHLENMVNPKVVKIAEINVAKRNNEIVTIEKITKIDDNKNLGEITPIINALKIDNFPLVHYNEKIIITEGMTDKIFLNLLQEAELLDKSIKVIPGSGVSNLGTLISLSIGITSKYVVIFDNDEAGREHFENYKKNFGDEESKKWILHKLAERKDNIVLEDYYSNEMKEIIEKYIDKKDYKTGLLNFYYNRNPEDKQKFSDELKKLSKKDKGIYILLEQIKKRLN
nr:MAG TPA: putative ATP-dependent endonuclease [Caudoviricetes sp.]